MKSTESGLDKVKEEESGRLFKTERTYEKDSPYFEDWIELELPRGLTNQEGGKR